MTGTGNAVPCSVNRTPAQIMAVKLKASHNGSPRVSVILPTYNGKRMIARAIRSILTQTYEDFELIIIDDGSTDGVGRLIKRTHDKRIRYIRHAKNAGTCKARNTGLKLARGAYIAYCDHDDIWYRRHLQEMVPILDKHSDIGLVYANYRTCGDTDFPSLYPVDYFVKELLEIKNIIGAPLNVVHRKECTDRVGGFSQSAVIESHSGEDWDLWLRMSDRFNFYHIDKVLAKFVYHKGNRSRYVDFSKSMFHGIKKRLGRYKSNKNADFSAFAPFLLSVLPHASAYYVREIKKKLMDFPDERSKKTLIHYCDALELYRKGLFFEAVPVFKTCIRYFSAPSTFKHATLSTLFLIAKSEFELRNYKRALRLFRHILKKDKSYYDAKEQLAMVYFKLGRYKRAQATARDLKGGGLKYNIQGMLLAKRGLYKKAVASFKKALRSDPAFLPAKKNLKTVQGYMLHQK